MLGHTKPLRLSHARLAALSAKFGASFCGKQSDRSGLICGKQSDRSGLGEEGFVGDS